jgi:predicted permease
MRLYRALLYLYPAGFRTEYGADMSAMFAARLQRASAAGQLLLWLEAVSDTLANAGGAHLDILRQDLRYTSRAIARSKGFAATAVLMTALGIGATTAAFSITDLVLIRPFSFADADRIVKIWERLPQYARTEPSPANYRDWKNQSQSFESMGAYTSRAANMVGGRQAKRLDGTLVTAEIFDILGADAAIGRLFTAADDRPGAPAVIVLSHAMWQAEFAGDSNVLGRAVRLDDDSYTVIGVMRPAFNFPTRETEVWLPFRFDAGDFEDRDNNYLHVLAKLKPGVSRDQAVAEMNLVTERLERSYPKENADTRATIGDLRDGMSLQTRVLLMALFGASLCLLLIACTNLASLLITRVIGRRGELAVRAALGAGRERLVRQLLTESLLLSSAGGLLGILVAMAALPLLARLVPVSLPIGEASALHGRVLLFASVLIVATALGFGVAPALRVCRAPDMNDLRAGTRSAVTRRGQRLRAVLVAAQVTASVALLVSAGLLIRALARVQSVDPGFRTADVLAIQTPLPWPKYAPTARRVAFYDRVLDDTRALPGVLNAAYITFLPMVMTGGIWPVEMKGTAAPPTDADRSVMASLRYVTPDLFATIGVPITRGRDVRTSDTASSQFVAIVSESFVRRYWPGEDPLGRQFKIAFFDRTVVGVAGDIRVRGLERESEPQVYIPYKQIPDGWMNYYPPKELVVRASTDAGSLVPAIRQIVANADPDLPLAHVRTLRDVVETQTAPRLTQLRVLQAFAAVALVLAGIGMHGLLAYAVSQRRSEIGLRLALGARPSNILGLVLGQALLLAALGSVAGVAIAYAAGHRMERLLAGIGPGDPQTFGVASLLALTMALAGSLPPALRALRIDAVSVMRAE